MLTLLTRDGRRTGNAVVYGINQEKNTLMIETDFGNRSELTLDEINKMFYLGHVTTYDQWYVDRRDTRMANRSTPEEGCSHG